MKALLVPVLILACSAHNTWASDPEVEVTRLDGPFFWIYDTLVPDGKDGLLYQTRGNPNLPFEGPAIWSSKGTPASTRRLQVPGYPFHSFVGVHGSRVVLQGFANHWGWPPTGIAAYDRLTGRNERLRPGGVAYSSNAALVASTDSGLFFGQGEGPLFTLYRTDGRPAGTRPVFTGNLEGLASATGGVLFWGQDHGSGPWAFYRARTGAAEKVGDFPGFSWFLGWDALGDFVPVSLVPFGSRAAFLQYPGGGAFELWVTDGTPEGSVLVHSSPDGLLFPPEACGNQLLFAVGWDMLSLELWATDGSPAGTRRLLPGTTILRLDSFRVADAGDGTCYFLTGGDPVADLWRTDLTADGTTLVASFDYFAGFGSSVRAVGNRGRVWFPNHGQLWTSDGTAAGTHAVATVLDAQPSHLARSGDRVFFVTSDVTSMETPLWVAQLPPALSIDDAASVEGPGGSWMTFGVRLSRRSSEEVRVGFTTESGSAQAGADFASTQGVLRFGPGERFKQLRVRILRDGVTEEPEDFRVRLESPSGAEIERGVATGVIRAFGSRPPGPRP